MRYRVTVIYTTELEAEDEEHATDIAMSTLPWSDQEILVEEIQ